MTDWTDQMRLVLTLPFNGQPLDAIRVWERATDDGTAFYIVTDSGNNPLRTLSTPEAAFSEAFSRGAWGVRARKATAKDYR